MNLKNSLTLLGAALLLSSLSNQAQAAAALPPPANDLYLVYSGTLSQANWYGGSTGTATETDTSYIYVIVDLANTNSYSVLGGDSHGYSIFSRILSTDGTTLTANDDGVAESDTNPAHNFINGVENQAKSNTTSPTKGYGVLRFSLTQTDTETNNNVSHDYPNLTEIYAAGALTGLSKTAPVTLVAANAKAKASGVYTVFPVPHALANYFTTGGSPFTYPYPASLTGTAISYGYDSKLQAVPDVNFPGAVSYMSVSGKITLKLNATLTAIANVGGSYKLKGQLNATAIAPVTNPLSPSNPLAYEFFLYDIAKSLGLPDSYVPGP